MAAYRLQRIAQQQTDIIAAEGEGVAHANTPPRAAKAQTGGDDVQGRQIQIGLAVPDKGVFGERYGPKGWRPKPWSAPPCGNLPIRYGIIKSGKPFAPEFSVQIA